MMEMDKQIYNVFCDESRQDLLASSNSITDMNRFCCIGGVMIPALAREEIKNNLKKLQEKYRVYGELKWGTVSPSKLIFYLELIDYFFSDSRINFRTVVIDSTKINNEAYNDADHELGYYKFYYQLLYHWLDQQFTYRIFTDQKTNRDRMRLRELKRILNNSYIYSTPIESIQAIDSRESIILQLENILMGAVGYKYNLGNSGKSRAKEQVIKRIEKNIGHEITQTIKRETKFNIFQIQLQGGY